MLELSRPWLAVSGAVVAAAVVWATRRKVGMPLALEDRPAGGRHRAVRWTSRAPDLLRFGSLACLVGVAAGPYRAVPVPGSPTKGVAIVVAMDVSESMGDAGLGGRRKLDVAIAEAKRFVGRREGDAIGLVVFGGEAAVRVPPTVDRAVVLDALGSLRAGELGDGTAIGTALGLAANRLRGIEARSRVILLITDGRSNAGALDPTTAARAAAALRQHVYVVAVDDGDVGLPLLERVASAGRGSLFEASDGAGLAEAYAQIDRMEPSTFAGRERTVRLPATWGLLWAALALVLAERGARAAGRLGALP